MDIFSSEHIVASERSGGTSIAQGTTEWDSDLGEVRYYLHLRGDPNWFYYNEPSFSVLIPDIEASDEATEVWYLRGTTGDIDHLVEWPMQPGQVPYKGLP